MEQIANFNWPLPTLVAFIILIIILIILYLLRLRSEGRPPFPPRRFPREEYFIQDQVILTGPEGVLDDFFENQAEGIQLRRLDRLAFREFGDRLQNCTGIPHSLDPGQGLVIDQYEITGRSKNVARALRRINSRLGDNSSAVIKEPNWVIGQPYEVEGSPYEVEGSPYEVEGSTQAKASQAAPPELLMSQWALATIGYNGAAALLAEQSNGRKVRVGVFDTSPAHLSPGSPPAIQQVQLARTGSPLPLQVIHPQPSVSQIPNIKPRANLRNHGYFIAGLILALAPDSDVTLVRVMEDDNRGDLFTLVKALFRFMLETVQIDPQPAGVVLNLSLGVRVAPEEAKFGLPGEVLALQYMVNAARCLGAVVVAASGNNSSRARVAVAANLPAAWASVFGVAASNRFNRRACFSNQGDIAAPGGDGHPAKPPAGDSRCRPRGAECTPENCDTDIVGPVLDPASPTGYIFWSGSSFAAPMVSALAALVQQAAGGGLSPSQVETIIACHAARTDDPFLGAGIIQVPGALEEGLRLRREKTHLAEPEQAA